MGISQIEKFLIACTVINYITLLIWFGVFSMAHSWLYGLHSRWFNISPENFDLLHYSGMAVYKIGVLSFNIAPLLAIIVIS
jgi:hypothetical protein